MHVQYDCKYLSPGYDPGNVGHGKKKNMVIENGSKRKKLIFKWLFF